MSMEDLLQAILGGAGAQTPSRGAQDTSQEDPLSQILGGILGGGAQQPSGSGPQAGPDIGDIIGSIFGGGAQQQPSGSAPQAGPDIGDIIGSIFGGGAQQPSRGAQQGAGGIGDILGGILGGGASLDSNTFLGPIVQKLAQQLGLPPAIAQMVVSFILNKMLAGGAAAPSQRRPSEVMPSQRPSQAVPQGQQGLDLDDLLEQMSAGQTLDTGYLSRTGMTNELSLQTGMDANTATMSLQQAFKLLGGALGAFQQPRQTTRTKRTASKRSPAQRRRTKAKSTKTTSRKRSKPKQEWTI